MTKADAVVLSAAHAYTHQTTTQLIHLAELLSNKGYDVQIALLRGGDRLQRVRQLGKVTVADDYRTKGVGWILNRLGRRKEAMWYRSWRTRDKMRKYSEATWIICDPEAAWFQRVLPSPAPTIVSFLADSTQRFTDIQTNDFPTMMSADLWLATADSQTEDLRANGVTAPIQTTGELPQPLPEIATSQHFDPSGPILVSTPSNSWDTISHTIEFIELLRRRDSEVPVLWMTDAGQDEWLAQHDLNRLDDSAQQGVSIRLRSDNSPLHFRLVVRTGYSATDSKLAQSASLEMIPTIGFSVADIPHDLRQPVDPFDVESLVERTLELSDRERRDQFLAEISESSQSQVDPYERLGPLLELLEEPVDSNPDLSHS